MPQVVCTEGRELHKTDRKVSVKRASLEILDGCQIARELTKTDMIDQRPYIAGAMCVMVVELVPPYRKFKLRVTELWWG